MRLCVNITLTVIISTIITTRPAPSNNIIEVIQFFTNHVTAILAVLKLKKKERDYTTIDFRTLNATARATTPSKEKITRKSYPGEAGDPPADCRSKVISRLFAFWVVPANGLPASIGLVVLLGQLVQ